MFAVFCEDPSMAKQDGDEEGYPYNKEHMPWFFDKAAADAVDAVDALANWFFPVWYKISQHNDHGTK
jgi:hypothetical protein